MSSDIPWPPAFGPGRPLPEHRSGQRRLLLAPPSKALLRASSPWSGACAALWDAEASVSLAGWELSNDLAHSINDGMMALSFLRHRPTGVPAP